MAMFCIPSIRLTTKKGCSWNVGVCTLYELGKITVFHTVLVVLALSGSSLAGAETTSIPVVPGPVTEVRQHLGRAIFFVDDKPFTDPLFATYHPTEDYFTEMAQEAGFSLFTFNFAPAAFDVGGGAWSESPDEFDYSVLDERCRNALKNSPNGLIMPRLFIGTPTWWLERYPEEMALLDNGQTIYDEPCNSFGDVANRPYPSIASPKWRQDMAHALQKAIDHIQSSDYAENIFGYQLGGLGSEEWYYVQVNQEQLTDYNPAMQHAFRDWLRGKYPNDEDLALAWGRSGITLDQAEIPTREERQARRHLTFRDPSQQMNVIDFDIFQSVCMADTINYFAGVVKQACGHQKVVGAYCNYSLDFSDPGFGHLAGQYMQSQCKNIDMLLNSPPWFNRQIGEGAEYSRRPMQSATLHNKISFYDFDGGTWLFPIVTRNWGHDRWTKGWTPEQIAQVRYDQGVTETAQESVWMHARSAGYTVCNNLYQSFFDLHGGYYSHPRMLEGVSEMREMLRKSAQHDTSSSAEMIAFFDEPSQAYMTFQTGWGPLRRQQLSWAGLRFQTAFIKSGAPLDIVYMADLPHVDTDCYKVFFFVNVWHMDDSLRQLVREKVMQPGKTVVWCYAPGFFSGNKSSAAFMEDLTGITVRPANSETLIAPLMELTSAGRDWLAQHGEAVPEEPFGLDETCCKLFYVEDTEAEALAKLPGWDTNPVTMARKQIRGIRSYYAISSVWTPEVVRALGKEAGVHFYNQAGDTLYANRSYLSVHAASVGDRLIELPRTVDVYDAMTERKLWSKVRRFSDSFMFGQTRTYRFSDVSGQPLKHQSEVAR